LAEGVVEFIQQVLGLPELTAVLVVVVVQIMEHLLVALAQPVKVMRGVLVLAPNLVMLVFAAAAAVQVALVLMVYIALPHQDMVELVFNGLTAFTILVAAVAAIGPHPSTLEMAELVVVVAEA
jgi:hypothetical protein